MTRKTTDPKIGEHITLGAYERAVVEHVNREMNLDNRSLAFRFIVREYAKIKGLDIPTPVHPYDQR